VYGTLRDLARVKNAPRSVRIQRPTDASGCERNIQTSSQHCSVPYSRDHQCGGVDVDYQYILKLHMHTTIYLRLCIKFLQQVACLISLFRVSKGNIFYKRGDIRYGTRVAYIPPGQEKSPPIPSCVSGCRTATGH